MINAYLKLVIKHPLLFLGLLAAITAGLGLGMLNLRFDHSIEAFMPKNDPEYRQYQKAKDMFGDNSRFLLLAVSNASEEKTLWTPSFMKAFDRMIADIETYKNFHPDKAEEQLQRLDRLLDKPPISFKQLTAAFSGDPVFLRLLKRKTPPRMQKKAQLSSADRKRLSSRIRQDLALKRAEMIDTLLSPFTANDISGEDDVLATYPLVETDSRGDRLLPKTPEAIAEFKARLLKNPAFQNGIYAYEEETGRITDFGVLITFTDADNRPAMVEEILAITEFHEDLEIYASGVPYVSRQFNLYMEKDLYRSTPIVLMVVVLIFFLNFKSVRGVLLPFSTLAMAEIWTLGLMGHLGYPITAIGITLPPLLISVGSSYAIHVLNKYYTDFNLIDPKNKSASLQSIMGHISVTVLLAGVTTAAAFATLTSSQISAIQQWAVFASLGILFAVWIALTLIPAVLRLMPHHYPTRLFRKGQTPKKTLVDRLLAATARTAVNHYKAVYIIVFIVIAVSFAGMLRLRVNTEFLHYFRQDDPTYQNTLAVGERFGGAWGLNIILDTGETNGVKSPAFLKRVEKLRAWLESDENKDLNVGRTDAFPDFIKRMHMAMHNGERDYFKIPEKRMTILDYLAIYSGEDENSDGVYDDFESFVDVFYQKLNIVARLADRDNDQMGTSEIKEIVGKIRSHLDETLPDKYDYTITGYPVINLKLAHYVVTSQLTGLALSLAFVMAVVIILFRKIAAGPLALIDMGVTIIINFGVMGWLGIELDMVTSVIATITIGIGVDDTIHFLNTYRVYRPESDSVAEAVEKTMAVSGKAIVFTSLALTFGFLSMVTSNFLPIVLFSLLIALTMINTTIGSVLLIPAAIRLSRIKL